VVGVIDERGAIVAETISPMVVPAIHLDHESNRFAFALESSRFIHKQA
jgi:hypothetical protein